MIGLDNNDNNYKKDNNNSKYDNSGRSKNRNQKANTRAQSIRNNSSEDEKIELTGNDENNHSRQATIPVDCQREISSMSSCHIDKNTLMN